MSKLAPAILTISMVDCSPVAAPIKRDNQCYYSTIVPDVKNDSPWVTDCEQLSRNIEGNDSWKVNLYDGWKKLASYGTCAFSAVSPVGELGAWVGNEDIRDLIRDGIRDHARDGKIGAKGEMECNAAFATLEWSIHCN